MAIPTFQDNALMSDVRTKSLNPAIVKINELDTQINHVGDVTISTDPIDLQDGKYKVTSMFPNAPESMPDDDYTGIIEVSSLDSQHKTLRYFTKAGMYYKVMNGGTWSGWNYPRQLQRFSIESSTVKDEANVEDGTKFTIGASEVYPVGSPVGTMKFSIPESCRNVATVKGNEVSVIGLGRCYVVGESSLTGVQSTFHFAGIAAPETPLYDSDLPVNSGGNYLGWAAYQDSIKSPAPTNEQIKGGGELGNFSVHKASDGTLTGEITIYDSNLNPMLVGAPSIHVVLHPATGPDFAFVTTKGMASGGATNWTKDSHYNHITDDDLAALWNFLNAHKGTSIHMRMTINHGAEPSMVIGKFGYTEPNTDYSSSPTQQPKVAVSVRASGEHLFHLTRSETGHAKVFFFVEQPSVLNSLEYAGESVTFTAQTPMNVHGVTYNAYATDAAYSETTMDVTANVTYKTN